MTGPIKTFPPKQPGETLDYDISFVNWLADRQDTVDSFTVTATAGLVIESTQLLNGVIRVSVSGGEHGQNYVVTARLVTVGPPVRKPEADVIIPVREAPRPRLLPS